VFQKSIGIFRRGLASAEWSFARSFGHQTAVSGRTGSGIDVHTSAFGATARMRPLTSPATTRLNSPVKLFRTYIVRCFASGWKGRGVENFNNHAESYW